MPAPEKSHLRYGVAIEKHYQFLLWVIPSIEKFPRSQKFLLGDRIQVLALEVLENLVQATFSRDRKAALNQANLKLELLRFLFRLAKDLHFWDLRRYEFAARAVDETGRLIGGWLKSAASEIGASIEPT